MAEVLYVSLPPITSSNYLCGSFSTIDGTPRTVGKKFMRCDTSFEVSKRQKTNSSSDFTVESFGIAEFIRNLEQTKERISVQSEKVDTEVAPTTTGGVESLFQDYDDQLEAVIQSERAKRIEEQNDLFQAKKLSLVLDLDHTLLHSIKFDEIDSVHKEKLKNKEEKDQQKPQRHLFCLPKLKFWTKLRPGIWSFLEQASKLYELHICTMGGQVYAKEMAKLLDPTGKLFGGRVVSKFGNGIKDLVGVLGMDSTAVIMDDTAKVWPNHRMNLIHVNQYTYFPSNKRKLELPGSTLFERNSDERAEGGILASSMGIIESVHRTFYSNPCVSLDKVDVRCILEEEKCNVLAGCHVLFSGVVAVDGAKPDQDPLWQAAREFGALCTTEMDSSVTHVVSKQSGTREVNWALASGKFVVSPKWIGTSVFLYTKADEKKFAVE